MSSVVALFCEMNADRDARRGARRTSVCVEDRRVADFVEEMDDRLIAEWVEPLDSLLSIME